MLWVYTILLVIIALLSLCYATYHLRIGIRGWRLAEKTKQRRQKPKEWVALAHEAYEYGVRGEYQKSIELAEKALQLNPRASEAWRLIGNAYEFLGDEMKQTGKYEEAENFHKKATMAWNKAKENNPNIIIPGYHE